MMREWGTVSKASLQAELARSLYTQSSGYFCILFSKSLSSLPSLCWLSVALRLLLSQ